MIVWLAVHVYSTWTCQTTTHARIHARPGTQKWGHSRFLFLDNTHHAYVYIRSLSRVSIIPCARSIMLVPGAGDAMRCDAMQTKRPLEIRNGERLGWQGKQREPLSDRVNFSNKRALTESSQAKPSSSQPASYRDRSITGRLPRHHSTDACLAAPRRCGGSVHQRARRREIARVVRLWLVPTRLRFE
jgi:hypothetical protein